MSEELKRHPRLAHFPFSKGVGKNDVIINDECFSSMIDERLVYTEKLDGSNVCLTRDSVYSRSHSGPASHISFLPLREFHSKIKYFIQDDTLIFGEWCYATHSVKYKIMQDYLNIFAVRNSKTGEWGDWDDVIDAASTLGVPTVPILLIGEESSKEKIKYNAESLASLSSVYGHERAGVVVRRYNGLRSQDGIMYGAAQCIRKCNKKITTHWTREPIDIQPVIGGIKKNKK